MNAGARQVFSFGPALIEKSQISVTEEDEVGKDMMSNPRTAIGFIDDLHYVFWFRTVVKEQAGVCPYMS